MPRSCCEPAGVGFGALTPNSGCWVVVGVAGNSIRSGWRSRTRGQASWLSSAALVWIGVGFALGFDTEWQAGLTCTTSIVTVVMLFAMQHLQSREQSATQRKLDEILRSLPGTDNRLIAVEERSDEELGALAAMNRQDSTS